MMPETELVVARDFSRVPAGRYFTDGDFTGEHFRALLIERLRTAHLVKVVLDGVEGFGSSFLEEAFGGLVRIEHFKPAELHDKLSIVARQDQYKPYVKEIWSYIDAK